MAKSRFGLHVEATTWRSLMGIGMVLHRLAPPWPPRPAFWKAVHATVSPHPGIISCAFYVPKDYHNKLKSKTARYPVVVNFHGGGFTIGNAEDDARWAAAVVDQTDAVVVSVDYRRAPEHPFPTAVEDGADSILYLIDNAVELGIDPGRIAVSGFSAGGNMAFTVPLRLEEELRRRKIRKSGLDSNIAPAQSAQHPDKHERVGDHPTSVGVQQAQENVTITTSNRQQGAITAICAFYPSTDFTATREERRKTNLRPDKELPRFFTNLFDASYLNPPEGIDTSNIYLSPACASDDVLRTDLPGDIIMFTCEWDELLAEGERFKDKLGKEGLGKRIHYRKVMGVMHGWDKSPNPLKPDAQGAEAYAEACAILKVVFEKGQLQHEMSEEELHV